CRTGSEPGTTADALVAPSISQAATVPLAPWYKRISDLVLPLKSPVCATAQPAGRVPTPRAEAIPPLLFMNQIPSEPPASSKMSLMPLPSKSPVPAMVQTAGFKVGSPTADLIVPLLFISHTAIAPLK